MYVGLFLHLWRTISLIWVDDLFSVVLDEVWKYFIEKFYIFVHLSVCFFFSTVVPYPTAMVHSSSSISVPNHVQTPHFCRFHSGLGGAASSATPTGSHLPKGLFRLNSPLRFFDSLIFLPWESLSTRPLKWYPSGAVSMATWKLSSPGYIVFISILPFGSQTLLTGQTSNKKKMGEMKIYGKIELTPSLNALSVDFMFKVEMWE